MEIKIFECKICKGFVQNRIRGEKRFEGTRWDVRKHLTEVHHIKGRRNQFGFKLKEFGKSHITNQMTSREFI